jgi:hypothetical protein
MKEPMDHEEVQELLEDAAVEPGGLERLMAGDTPNAALVAGHLAGCSECSEEMERLRRTVGMIRPAVRAVPPPELRQRTLDYVAALGRPRGATATVGAAAVAATSGAGASIVATPLGGAPASGASDALSAPEPIRIRRRSGVTRWAIAGSLAAALAVAIFGAGLLVGGNGAGTGTGAQTAAEIEALGDVARWTMKVDGQPDARRVTLASADGSPTTATVLFSPSTTDLVVVANDLAPAPAGTEYRCWVEVNGVRKPIGKMFFGDSLAYWVGDVGAVAGLPANATFGVTLVDRASPDPSAQPVLTGIG